jgi:heme-degrading monooxygenase HmoA
VCPCHPSCSKSTDIPNPSGFLGMHSWHKLEYEKSHPQGFTHTHHRDIVFYQQRGFLSALFKDAHGLGMGGSQEPNSIHAEQPVSRFDGALSRDSVKEQS